MDNRIYEKIKDTHLRQEFVEDLDNAIANQMIYGKCREVILLDIIDLILEEYENKH